jgi:transposase InsO family protein
LFRLFYDTLGPQKVYGFCGELYTSILIDDCTRMTWHVNTRTKRAAGQWLLGQLRHLIARYQLPVVFLHTDNAREYSLNDQELFEQHGVVHSHGVPYVSEFQGVVERCNRTVSEITRVVHVQSNLCRRFWPYGMNTANAIYRTRPNSSLPDEWSPLHALECHAVSSRELHPFGCVAWVKVMSDAKNGCCS